MKTLADQLDAVLPQTQCRECDFAGCRPYAEAMARGNAQINRCPPGGIAVLEQLAELLNLDAEQYRDQVLADTREPATAIIREAECIGCTKCIQACPVDAIIGAGKLMHSIIAQECTGCGLCIEPCPVDCIDLQSLTTPNYDRDKAKARYQARQERLEQRQKQDRAQHQQAKQASIDKAQSKAAKLAHIQAALAQAKQKRDNHE